MRTLAEPQMKPVGRPPLFVAPDFFEGGDDRFFQIAGNMSHIVAEGSGDLLDHRAPVSFTT